MSSVENRGTSNASSHAGSVISRDSYRRVIRESPAKLPGVQQLVGFAINYAQREIENKKTLAEIVGDVETEKGLPLVSSIDHDGILSLENTSGVHIDKKGMVEYAAIEVITERAGGDLKKADEILINLAYVLDPLLVLSGELAPRREGKKIPRSTGAEWKRIQESVYRNIYDARKMEEKEELPADHKRKSQLVNKLIERIRQL